MDSLTQIALGSAVGIAVMGRRTAPWKAALAGAIGGTLPDLDVFINHGDAIRNMTMHRTESHALFYLTLAAPLLAWGYARLIREMDRFKRWWLAIWLILITHPLLDTMTVYGTQLGLPFTDYPYGVGSVFIIDPTYTLPLLAGVAIALWRRNRTGQRWNLAGIVFSTAYLLWGVAVQSHVAALARTSLQQQGIAQTNVLVTPTPFNTVLWRIVAMTPDGYAEGMYSLFDSSTRIPFDRFARDTALYEHWRGNWNVDRIAGFSHGFFKMSEQNGKIVITDIRMGQEPGYTFNFVVGERTSRGDVPVTPQLESNLRRSNWTLRWLWRRALGEPLPPPRASIAGALSDATVCKAPSAGSAQIRPRTAP